MKISLLIFGLMLLSFNGYGQEATTITARFTNTPYSTIFERIESQTGYSIYYDTEALDSLFFTGEFANDPIAGVFDALIENTKLFYYIKDQEVYVTKDVEIVHYPKIARLLRSSVTQPFSEIEQGLFFRRDYLSESMADKENRIIELGSRKNMIPGAMSTIAGFVRNSDNGEALEGAVLYTEDQKIITTTNKEGFYSIKLPNGRYSLFAQYLGMKTTRRNIVVLSNDQLNIEMEVDVISLMEITIESGRVANLENVQMGISKIDVNETKNVPVVLGEKDVLKIATTLAGVQTMGEGSSGFNVRGGKADQNLITINEAPVYNTSHFFGFFSVFNSDAIERMDIYKSGIPANLGGRLSSVFEIESKRADREKMEVIGGVSPITTKLSMETPLHDGKGGLLLAGRTTYSNWVLKRVENANFRENRVSFSDFLASYDVDLTDKTKLEVNGYLSNDKFRISSDTLFSFSNFSFSNANGSIKLKREVNATMDLESSAIYSQYGYEILYDESKTNAFTQDFGIAEFTAKSNLNYYPNDQHLMVAGAEVKYLSVQPGTKLSLGPESTIIDKRLELEKGIQSALYLSDEYNFSEEMSVYAGLRFSHFSQIGPQTVLFYEEGRPKNSETVVRAEDFGKGSFIATYFGLEPRLSIRYNLDRNSSVKSSYNRTKQYVHTMTNSASLSPTDTWRLSGTYLKPQVADQFSVGYYRNFRNNSLETSVESYYKNIRNLVDFKVGGEFLLNEDVEQVTLQGPGKSYGVELSVKKSGKLNGWINYSFARTFIKLDGAFPEDKINKGEYYPANFDIPHTINMVANYKLTHRLSFSYNFVYSTGRPVTFPVGVFNFKGVQAVHYSDRNAFRIPYYMRMDLGINLEAGHRLAKLMHSYWSVSIYNLLGRENPYSVYFDIREGQVQGYKLIIFGRPIPTLSYNFRF